MSVRSIRKAIGFLALDFVLIIGIFILQFRTDSNIIKKIGNLQINLAKTESLSDQTETEVSLQNKMLVSYNGMILRSNEQNLAKVIYKNNSEPKDVQLVDCIVEGLETTFVFNDNIKLLLSLADESLTAPLTIKASLPNNVTDLFLPYSFAKNMTIQEDEGNKVILDGKKNLWLFSTDSVENGYIHFTKKHPNTHYGIYDNTKKFTFESIIELASASEEAFNLTFASLKSNLIQNFKLNSIESNLTEAVIVSYIAAMSQDGKYQDAIDDIPANFKKDASRTYLSAPYFNSLVNMNKELEEKITSLENLIKKASSANPLEIFTNQDLAFFLVIHPSASEAKALLQLVSQSDITNASLAQITGILQCFTDLSSYKAEYAQMLLPLINPGIEKIKEACKYENDILSLSENDTFLSVIQAVKTGIELKRYGKLVNNEVYEKAGIVLINSYIGDSSSFDLRTLASIYSLFDYKNPYYPHFELIDANANNPQWAWTCANKISKEIINEELVITIDFPKNLTHYVILKGIPSFEKIFIYDMDFRTDHRFETYNSSGYVYENKNDTLLLKSRHKSDPEIIRMSYKKEVATEVITPKEEASSTSTNTNTEESKAESESSTSPTTNQENSPKTNANTSENVDQFLPPSMRGTINPN